MSEEAIPFVINDSLTINQNLEEFINYLKIFDEPLADRLSAKINDISNDVAIDQGQLLDNLYTATAPVPQFSIITDHGNEV